MILMWLSAVRPMAVYQVASERLNANVKVLSIVHVGPPLFEAKKALMLISSQGLFLNGTNLALMIFNWRIPVGSLDAVLRIIYAIFEYQGQVFHIGSFLKVEKRCYERPHYELSKNRVIRRVVP